MPSLLPISSSSFGVMRFSKWSLGAIDSNCTNALLSRVRD